MNACPHPELRRITEDEAAALPVRMTHICVHCEYPLRETVAPDVYEVVVPLWDAIADELSFNPDNEPRLFLPLPSFNE